MRVDNTPMRFYMLLQVALMFFYIIVFQPISDWPAIFSRYGKISI